MHRYYRSLTRQEKIQLILYGVSFLAGYLVAALS